MKTIFDTNTREELLKRIDSLSDKSTAQWGKMNVYQVLAHCTKWDKMMQGNIQVKRMFLGKIFGKLALRSMLKNDKPLGKNTPTAPEFVIKEKEGDIVSGKEEAKKKISEYEHWNNPHFIHPFFGSMTKEQVGQLVYKHYDHHLRQFGV